MDLSIHQTWSDPEKHCEKYCVYFNLQLLNNAAFHPTLNVLRKGELLSGRLKFDPHFGLALARYHLTATTLVPRHKLSVSVKIFS